MRPICPKCSFEKNLSSRSVKSGSYFRSSDGQKIQRYECLACCTSFSSATWHECYRQKKRQMNEPLRKLLANLVSQRSAARILKINRKTVARKNIFIGVKSEFLFRKGIIRGPKAKCVEFDDLETFEHTKCKPLSITLAVETGTRRILGLEVSVMAAKGLLVDKAKKYGPRVDDRKAGRRRLFQKIRPYVEKGADIKSDENPHYPKDVKKFFPNSKHRIFPGRRGSLGGQGELKKIGFDPLFSLNHTCAMFRAHVNRLIRKTWCTTKKPERLYNHLMIYAHYHNEQLKLQ